MAQVRPEMMNNQLVAPTKIPHNIVMVATKEPPRADFSVADNGFGASSDSGIFGSGAPEVKVAAPKKVNVSGGVMAGMAISSPHPTYPPIARAARIQGTVVLEATISKTGTIENLHVVSGPAMLTQAAVDAVKNWRYRPYLLDGQPTEVETQVNVVFTMGG